MADDELLAELLGADGDVGHVRLCRRRRVRCGGRHARPTPA
jgi:hypothetical protein